MIPHGSSVFSYHLVMASTNMRERTTPPPLKCCLVIPSRFGPHKPPVTALFGGMAGFGGFVFLALSNGFAGVCFAAMSEFVTPALDKIIPYFGGVFEGEV